MTVLARVTLATLAPDAPVRVRLPPYDVLVVRTDDGYFAIEDACPHSGASLSEGRVADGCVTCPMHGWVIALRDGRVLTEAGRGGAARAYATQIEGDALLILAEQP